MEQQIADSLIASGPLGAALALLGLVLRSWIHRLQDASDELRTRIDALRDTVQAREVAQAQELAKLTHQVATHTAELDRLHSAVHLPNGVQS